MSGSNREIIYHEDGFVIAKDRGIGGQPLDCPVCGYFMLSDTDTQFWNDYQCCHECGVMWAEGPNREKWKNGWRPEAEVIKLEVERRSKIVPRLKL